MAQVSMRQQIIGLLRSDLDSYATIEPARTAFLRKYGREMSRNSYYNALRIVRGEQKVNHRLVVPVVTTVKVDLPARTLNRILANPKTFQHTNTLVDRIGEAVRAVGGTEAVATICDLIGEARGMKNFRVMMTLAEERWSG